MGAEIHIVGTDEGGRHAKTFHGIGGRQEEGISFFIDKIIGDIGILHLLGKFAIQTETLVPKAPASGPCGHILRNLVNWDNTRGRAVGTGIEGGFNFRIGFFKLTDKRSAYTGHETGLLHFIKHLIKRDFGIQTAHKVLSSEIAIKIKPFYAPNTFNGHSLVWVHLHAGAHQTVVDAQLTVLIRAKHQTVAELLIVVTSRYMNELVLIIGKEIADTLSFVVDFLKINQWEHVKLIARASGKATIGVQQIEEGVASHLGIHLLGPDKRIGDIVHAIETEITTDTTIAQLMLGKG